MNILRRGRERCIVVSPWRSMTPIATLPLLLVQQRSFWTFHRTKHFTSTRTSYHTVHPYNSITRSVTTTTPINSGAGTVPTRSLLSPTTFDVRIVEVGPRDGLQNEPSMIVPTEDKVQLIQLLMHAGCRHLEVGSFVSATAVPNMANSPHVLQRLSEVVVPSSSSSSSGRRHHPHDVSFSALVPTLRYLHDALPYRDTVLHEIAIFASASESFSQKVRAPFEYVFPVRYCTTDSR